MSIVCVTEVHAVVILERDDYNYFLPGLIAVCDGNQIKKNGYHGAPDLVAEVVSISSRSLDYIRKLVKYEHAGVREYWIVDPLRNVVMVYDFEAGEMEQHNLKEKIKVNIFDGLVVDFSQLELT